MCGKAVPQMDAYGMWLCGWCRWLNQAAIDRVGGAATCEVTGRRHASVVACLNYMLARPSAHPVGRA